MTLHYRLTSWLTYKSKIAAILTSSMKIIADQIAQHGEEGKLIIDNNGEQRFWNWVQDGFEVKVTNIKPYAMTWGDMRQLFMGLRARCWLQTCNFQFSVGSGARIGKGSLYKA